MRILPLPPGGRFLLFPAPGLEPIVTPISARASTGVMCRMDSDRLLTTLLRAARSEEGSAADVPAGFDERVMRAIGRVRRDEALEAWASGLWRAALSSAGIAGLVGGAAMFLAVFGDSGVFADPEQAPGVVAEESPIDELLIHDLESGELL